MFRRILVPIDNSKAAKLALEKAIEFCQQHNAKLRIVHAIDYIALSAGIEGIDADVIHNELKAAADKLLNQAKIKAAKKNVKADIKLIESFKLTTRVDSLILKAVQSWRADLVVVGMNKKGGLEKLFYGSHSKKMIEKIAAPILLIKSKS